MCAAGILGARAPPMPWASNRSSRRRWRRTASRRHNAPKLRQVTILARESLTKRGKRPRPFMCTTARRKDPRERQGDSVNESAQHETPHVGIFWLVQTLKGETRLLAATCPLDQAEPYGDCLTYGPGHYETWDHWRRDRTINPALRAIVRSYEYEDWPRGRIVFDQTRDLFVLYADRKPMTPATIARIATQFHLPAERIEVQSDFHYQSTETRRGLCNQTAKVQPSFDAAPITLPRKPGCQ
jgi:hypothetical protein